MEKKQYLLPRPREVRWQETEYQICFDTRIVLGEGVLPGQKKAALLLREEIEKSCGFSLMLAGKSGRAGGADIRLEIGEEASQDEQKKQGYRLKISPEGVLVRGNSYAGLLNGVQTLRQMISQRGACLLGVEISDWPALGARGFYHDVTRGRIPTLESLKKLADKMAFYKLNQLQLYIEHSFLFEDMSEIWRDTTPLTAADILELDAYCGELGIELVPSLSSFGHLYELLRTRQYRHLCELDHPEEEPYSLVGRLQHHTIDVSNPESMELVKGLIGRYMELFTSDKFNICADETFDLGRGKNSGRAQAEGITGVYMEFVSELCRFVVQKGKTPMFWGDIICGFPEEIKKLPKETVCLNWGYAPEEKEDNTRKLSQAGAVQYLCPGVCGWNQWVNLLEGSYENIRRMCTYAVNYDALGVLNTDWGDYGHINHPSLSVPGLIYGAAFSWMGEILPFEEINKEISKLEYRDASEGILKDAAKTAACVAFEWNAAVRFCEARGGEEEREKIFRSPDESQAPDFSKTGEKNRCLEEIAASLGRRMAHMDRETRAELAPFLIGMRAIRLFNSVGAYIGGACYGMATDERPDPMTLAGELEEWFYHYKELWRSSCRESELSRIAKVVYWYADFLRDNAGKRESSLKKAADEAK